MQYRLICRNGWGSWSEGQTAWSDTSERFRNVARLHQQFLIDGETIETDKRDPEYQKADITKLHLWPDWSKKCLFINQQLILYHSLRQRCLLWKMGIDGWSMESHVGYISVKLLNMSLKNPDHMYYLLNICLLLKLRASFNFLNQNAKALHFILWLRGKNFLESKCQYENNVFVGLLLKGILAWFKTILYWFNTEWKAI